MEFYLGIEAILSFFDERADGSEGHAAALNAVMGEELAEVLLCRCIVESFGGKARVLTECESPITPKLGTLRGNRLDRWILSDTDTPDVDRILYQVEIKNWNAHSYGGRPLSVRASDEEVKRHRMRLWRDNWSEEERRFVEEEANKVLLRMEPPAYCDDETGKVAPLPAIAKERIMPLISFWFPVHPEGLGEALFFKPFPAGPINGFPGVWVFSMSNYLRTKMVSGTDKIAVRMPVMARRIEWLNRMFSSTPLSE